MKTVVIGGSGLIGSKLVKKLREIGQEVMAASTRSGVNTITGAGLDQALRGAQVVVDVTNAPMLGDKAVLEFFETSTRNLLAAEAVAGVRHHVGLSVVGTERIPESGYFRAKLAQEQLIKVGRIPYTILRSTQFFELISSIIEASLKDGLIHLSPALLQPIASDDVVTILAELAVGTPLNGTIEVAGPDACPVDKFAREFLTAAGDKRQVIADVRARYFGAQLNDRSLTSSGQSRLGAIHFGDWLRRTFT
jgi:uncharacterized protein YbjT (DUF2867 family)